MNSRGKKMSRVVQVDRSWGYIYSFVSNPHSLFKESKKLENITPFPCFELERDTELPFGVTDESDLQKIL